MIHSLVERLRPHRSGLVFAGAWLLVLLAAFVFIELWLPEPPGDLALERYVDDAKFFWFWGLSAAVTIALTGRALRRGADSLMPLLPALAPAAVSAWRYFSEAGQFVELLGSGVLEPIQRPELAASMFTKEATLGGIGTSISLALLLGVIAVQRLLRPQAAPRWTASRTLVTVALVLGLGATTLGDLHAQRFYTAEFAAVLDPGVAESYTLFRLRLSNATLGELERIERGVLPVLGGAVAAACLAVLLLLRSRGQHARWVFALTLLLGGMVFIRGVSDRSRAPVYEALRELQAQLEPQLEEAIAATADQTE